MTSPSAAAAVVTATGLGKTYGDRRVLEGVSLALPAGRAYGLLGPNGAGKTTTVRLLNGLIAPTEGSIEVFGEALTASVADRLRARIGVQTDTSIYGGLTVRENLRAWADLYDVPPNQVARRIDDLLQVLVLADRADSRAGELSKGMRQKLAVGRAVLHAPELLYLDEPTAGLDPEASADLLDYVQGMMRERRMTVVICTHQLQGLEALCDEVGILVGGRLVASGAVGDLVRSRWPERRFRLDVGDPATAAEVVRAVTGAEPETAGESLTCALDAGTAIEDLVAALVRRGIRIRAVVPLEPTIQDLYFATIADAKPAARPEDVRAAA